MKHVVPRKLAILFNSCAYIIRNANRGTKFSHRRINTRGVGEFRLISRSGTGGNRKIEGNGETKTDWREAEGRGAR